LTRLPALASKSVRSRFLHFINCRRDPNTVDSLLETIALSEGNLSYPFRFWRLAARYIPATLSAKA
jgi:hypothetical protein